MRCLILAGGLGTRMYPATEAKPKVLLEANGRPFAHYQLDWLKKQGVNEVVFSIGHLGEQVREELGAGDSFGMRVSYVDEGEKRLGTGGAVRLAVDEGALEGRFLVMYGDSFLPIDYSAPFAAATEGDEAALMVVYPNADQWDASNVRLVQGRVDLYLKQRDKPDPTLDHIDYGLAVLTADVISEIPPGEPYDLATLYHELSKEGRLAAHVAERRFYEIGSPEGLKDFEAWIKAGALD